MKTKKRYLIDVQFSTDKKLTTMQYRQRLQNTDKKQYCQYLILRLVVFTRFRADRDCLLMLYYMLVKSARTVSRELYWENVSTLGLLHMVSWGCCDNTLLLCKTCLNAVYYRPMWHRAGLLKLWVAVPNEVAKFNFGVAEPIGLTNQM